MKEAVQNGCSTWQHNVSKAQQAKLGILIMGFKGPQKQDFNGSIKFLRHCHHHVSAENPENVIKEQASLQQGEGVAASGNEGIANDMVRRP